MASIAVDARAPRSADRALDLLEKAIVVGAVRQLRRT